MRITSGHRDEEPEEEEQLERPDDRVRKKYEDIVGDHI